MSKLNDRIVAFIVAYYPDYDLLRRNILAIREVVSRVIIWRNSILDEKNILSYCPDCLFMGDSSNMLIAKPINAAIQYCAQFGYDWLLTMDQDSLWVDFKGFVNCVMSDGSEAIAVYAPDAGNLSLDYSSKYCDVESVITSGSLLNVSVAQKLGGMREDYGIYWVDGEYCYWARRKGYLIRVFPNSKLVQRFGKKTKTIFGFTTPNYSPQVYYYMIRNMLWMKREFHQSVSMKCVVRTLIISVRGIVLGEKHKVKKISKIIIAIFDGLFNDFQRRCQQFQ